VAGISVGIGSSRGTREVDFDVCIVDEGSKAAPPELLVPLARQSDGFWWEMTGNSLLSWIEH